MNSKKRVTLLIEGIQSDLALYARLNTLLDHHYLLLTRHDTDGLTGSNQQQIKLMMQMKRNAQERCEHLQAFGLSPNKNGMGELITHLPEPMSTKVGQLWQQLKKELYNCKNQNDINGRLLAGQVETLHNLLGHNQQHEYGELAR